MNTLSFDVIYDQDEVKGFTVSVPALPGCISEGDTFEEATNNIKDAITLYLQSLKSEKKTISQPSTSTLIGTVHVSIAT